jgi:hypothetical protein
MVHTRPASRGFGGFGGDGLIFIVLFLVVLADAQLLGGQRTQEAGCRSLGIGVQGYRCGGNCEGSMSSLCRLQMSLLYNPW